MENKHKHYLKFFETRDEYNNQKYLDIDDPNYIMGDPHVVMIGNDGDVKNIIFFDSTRFSRNYFTIEALEDDMLVKFSRNNLEYRIIGKTNHWNILSSNTYINLKANQKIQFKMTNPTISSSSGIGTFEISKSCNIEGNIMSLLYGDNFVGKTDLTGDDYVFYKLFYKCTTIKNAKNLVLSAETLAKACYQHMFEGCTSLVTAPSLPATTLAELCYSSMFYGCTSLVNAPKVLPATTLAYGCCAYMFYNCRSLVTAPSLPATTLASDCYEFMFYGCTSLVTAPELPAETLATYCYESMFFGCNKLETAPELPATTLANYCYRTMFFACTSLVNAPEILPAETLADGCYASMFYNCTSLVTAPELPATTLASDCCGDMFNGCTSLVNAPEILPATTLANNCYRNMFYGCTSLVNAPALPATTLASYCYVSMFEGCTSLVNAPALPATTLAEYCYEFMFSGCHSLVAAPEVLPAETLANYCYYGMFSGCHSLVAAPEVLPAETLADSCYRSMFSGCTSLATAPELPATTLAKDCYYGMFNGCASLATAPELLSETLTYNCYNSMFDGCTSLVNAPALPATTLANNCYYSMFDGCTSLVNAPALPAETLANYCYSYMFRGCTSLVNAPALPAETLANYCYSYMFNGCIKLNYIKMLATDISVSGCLTDWVSGVSEEGGTFYKNIKLTSKDRGKDGIPNGWTVYVDDCVSPSFINTLNSEVNFYNVKDIYTPNSSNILLDKYTDDEILSMQPECDLYIDIVYRYKDDNTGEIITEKYLWENTESLNDILNDILKGLDKNSLDINKIVIIIVGIIEPEETGYYDNSFDNSFEHFTIEALEDGLTVSLTRNEFQYRIDKGTWTSLSYDDYTTPVINAGQKIQFKMTNPRIFSSYGIGTFAISKSCNIEGNIMSLLYGDDFVGQTDLTGKNDAFYKLFDNCTTIKNAINLVLPATTLSSHCYAYMFRGCTSLVTAPELPATSLAESCYSSMFYGCTSLVNAPELPATSLASYCYSGMFQGCTSLVNAPELPATSLTNDCYYRMFYGCTSLVNAPELPATTLPPYCYSYMFYGCSNLNYIKMLAIDIGASNCLTNWVSGVSEEGGTFYKNINLNSIERGENGIPNGWKVYVDIVDCDPPSFINALDSDVDFTYDPRGFTLYKNSLYKLLSNGVNVDQMLTINPVCDLRINIVNNSEIIEEGYTWLKDTALSEIIAKFNLYPSPHTYKFVIIIVGIVEQE